MYCLYPSNILNSVNPPPRSGTDGRKDGQTDKVSYREATLLIITSLSKKKGKGRKKCKGRGKKGRKKKEKR